MTSPGSRDAVPQLERFRRGFEEQKTQGRNLLEAVGEDRFNTRPEPHRWSVAECFGHLNETGRAYVPRIEAALSEGRRRRMPGTGPFGLGLMGSMFVKLLEPPPSMRLKAPKAFHPPLRTYERDAVLGEFVHCQDEFIRLVREAAGLDLSRLKLASPATNLVRLNTAAAFAVSLAHERRHLWQARRVREELEAGEV